MEWYIFRLQRLGFPDPEEYYMDFVKTYGLECLDMVLTDLEDDLYVD